MSLRSIFGVLSLAAVLWTGCSPPPDAAPGTGGAPPVGGTLVASVRAEPRAFNRYVASDATSDLVSHLTHAKLVRIDRVSEALEPQLATAWSGDASGLVYTLELRPGVRWSDGRPFTAADVEFSFEAVYAEATASPLADALRVAGAPLEVRAVDEATVEIRFPSPFGPGLRLLDNLPILPRHRLEAPFRAGDFPAAWGLSSPTDAIVGLGPFVLAAYEPGERLVLHRNPHYWGADDQGRPLPYLDRVVLEIIPDQNAELVRLESSQLDLLQNEVRAEDYALLKRAAGSGRLQLVDLGVGLDPSFLWFNLDPAAKASDPRRAWLQSVELRRAISHAVDRQSFADTVFLGAGVPVEGPVTPGNRRWYTPDVRPYPYDPAAAARLLDGLDLRDRDGDGLREDRAGRPARFALLTQKGHTARERGAAVLQEDLRRVGLAMDVVALEVGALIDEFGRRDYDAMYFGTLASDTDPAVNLDFWLSSGHFHIWHPAQASPATAWERRIDELMTRQSATLELGERQRLFAEVQRVFAEQVPALYFVAPRVVVAMSTRVMNATPVLLRPQVLWNAEALAVRDAGP